MRLGGNRVCMSLDNTKNLATPYEGMVPYKVRRVRFGGVFPSSFKFARVGPSKKKMDVKI